MKQHAATLVAELKQAFRDLGRALGSREGLILTFATLFFAMRFSLHEAEWLPDFLDRFYRYGHYRQVRLRVTSVLCYGILPLLVVLAIHRESPTRNFGLRLPPTRWIVLTLGISAVHLATIPLWGEMAFMADYYPMFKPARRGGVVFWQWSALMLVAMFSWEFVVRGYLMLGLKPRFGMMAVLIQNVPFVILHIGKPVEELFFSVLAGLGLGLLAYVSNSVWPAVFLHGVGAFAMDFYLVYVRSG